MLKIPGLEEEIPSEFPCKYLQAHEWGWSMQEATKLFNHFDEWLYCDRVIQKSGLIQKRKGVAFAVDPGHSQCRGTYDENLQTVEEQDHCDGPVLHLRRDGSTPEEVIKLAVKLTEYIRTMQGYERRTVNYISVMKYADHEVGIDWHKHNEDDGCDTPTFIVSTGAERPFHIARIQKGWPPVPNPAER